MSPETDKTVDIDYLRQWVGKEQVVADDMSRFKAEALSAALHDERSPLPRLYLEDSLPAGWQWLYFLDTPIASDMGDDGHPKTGGFLPPVPLPRRMWAAGKFEIKHPMVFGASATKRSVVSSVDLKHGKTGALAFVTVEHSFSQSDRVCIEEEQTIVYREMPRAASPLPNGRPASDESDWSRLVVPNPVLLFRFSALTYNAHRIHYDRQYATEAEYYPALVVHSPLQAILLANSVAAADTTKRIRTLSFRAERPLFDTDEFFVCGCQDSNDATLWTRDHEGFIATSSAATLVSKDADR